MRENFDYTMVWTRDWVSRSRHIVGTVQQDEQGYYRTESTTQSRPEPLHRAAAVDEIKSSFETPESFPTFHSAAIIYSNLDCMSRLAILTILTVSCRFLSAFCVTRDKKGRSSANAVTTADYRSAIAFSLAEKSILLAECRGFAFASTRTFFMAATWVGTNEW